MAKVTIPKYSLGEEIINSITHGIGALMFIPFTIMLIIKTNTMAGVITSLVFGFFAILLYVCSCIYHALSPRITGKKVLRVIDHCNVLLMVAGTYTPICICLFKGTLGWILFSIIWIITIFAVTLTAINLEKFNWLSAVSNLIVGWGSLFLIKVLYNLVGASGLFFLITGGVLYSIGAILYALGKKKKYMHSVFHVFVLVASIFHFLFIYLYCI